MAKPKQKKMAPRKSQKGTSSRDRRDRDRGARSNTEQRASVVAAPHPQGAKPTEKGPEKQVEPPFIVRFPFKTLSWTGDSVAGIIFGLLLTHSFAHAHGAEGAAKIASATILPVIVLMCLLEVTRHRSMRASALGLTARGAVISLLLAFLIEAPSLWRATGYEEVCWHVFLGGVSGYVVAFFAWVYLIVKRHPWLMQRQYGQWAWFYRLSAVVMIIIGGWIGLIAGLDRQHNFVLISNQLFLSAAGRSPTKTSLTLRWGEAPLCIPVRNARSSADPDVADPTKLEGLASQRVHGVPDWWARLSSVIPYSIRSRWPVVSLYLQGRPIRGGSSRVGA